MGALPKRKISKARKGRRRSHNALTSPAMSVCPKCGKPKRPHFKCEYCGHYGSFKRESADTKANTSEKKVSTAQATKKAKKIKKK